MRYIDAQDWAEIAVMEMRRDGSSPRDILRAFEKRWSGVTEPTWDDVVAKVAEARFRVRSWPKMARRGAPRRKLPCSSLCTPAMTHLNNNAARYISRLSNQTRANT